MTSMVERVARVLKVYAASVDLKSGANPSLEMARAAIEAMREPTWSMVEAGQDVNNILPEPHEPTHWQGLSRDEMTEAYQAMIDEALK